MREYKNFMEHKRTMWNCNEKTCLTLAAWKCSDEACNCMWTLSDEISGKNSVAPINPINGKLNNTLSEETQDEDTKQEIEVLSLDELNK